MSALKRFRMVSMAEGISYILLLFVAMPLKYFADLQIAVKVAGWIHGALFVVYCLTLLHAMIKQKWNIFKAALLFISSLVPFGAFVAEWKYLKNEAER